MSIYDWTLADFDPEYELIVDDLVVQVEKVGGGTLGRSYRGAWAYRVYRRPGLVLITTGADYQTALHKTHATVAVDIAERMRD